MIGLPTPRARTVLSLGLFVLGLAAFGLFQLLLGFPSLVEAVYVDRIARTVVPPFSRALGVVPVPVAELAVVGYVLRRGWVTVRGMGNAVRGRRRILDLLVSAVLVLLRDAGVVLLLFYGLWGYHYAREPVADRLGLPELGEVATADLAALAEEMTEVANESYRELHGSEDAGTPTAMPTNRGELEDALELGWARAAGRYRLGPLATARFGPPKPLISSPLVAYLGITGIYSPWTAEPLLVGTVPAIRQALTLAHEQAHQRGVTNEGEATFMGFLVAMRSDHPLLRYSASVRAQERLLGALAGRDPELQREILLRRHPGIRRDLQDYSEYVRAHDGAPARAQEAVNDAYLRTNRVPGGVQSYGQITELLLRLAIMDSVTLLPEESEARLD